MRHLPLPALLANLASLLLVACAAAPAPRPTPSPVTATTATTANPPTAADGGFDCEDLVCGPQQRCEIRSGGAVRADGSTSHSRSCLDLPAPCRSNPTCACLASTGESMPRCNDVDGHVRLLFLAP